MSKPAVLNEHDLAGLIELLSRLEAAKIHFTLARNRDDAITVDVAVPGQRWERRRTWWRVQPAPRRSPGKATLTC